MIARLAAVAIAAAINLPAPVPPETRGLAPGYHLTPHGCITNEGERAFAAVRARGPYDGESNDARITRLRAMIDQAENTRESSWTIDRAYRLPLSVALYRAHRVEEARSDWRSLLSRATGRTSSDEGTRAALDGHFHDALVAYALNPPGFNRVTFGDSGAAYNLQRGLNAGAQNDLAGADTFLNFALECSSFFQVPHLALGVMAAMRHDLTTARHEWLASVEGWDPTPPDTASITTAQYDALRLLLQFG